MELKIIVCTTRLNLQAVFATNFAVLWAVIRLIPVAAEVEAVDVAVVDVDEVVVAVVNRYRLVVSNCYNFQKSSDWLAQAAVEKNKVAVD